MAKKQPFTLLYDEQFETLLKGIERKHYSFIRDTIEEQLQFEPDVPTKNRKRLRAPGILNAGWEIRFGPDNRFRVFYDVDVETHEVRIFGIGVKQGNRVSLGGEEIDA